MWGTGAKKTLNKWRLLGAVVTLLVFAACSQSGSEEITVSQTASDAWKSLKPVPISLESEASGEAMMTRNFYFIMDGSGSMDDPLDENCGGDQRFSKKIDGARWALERFLEHVPADVNLGLYVFDSNGEFERLPLGPANRDSFLEQIHIMNVGSGTPLAQAIKTGTDKLVEQYREQLGYGEFRLIVVTDGLAESLPNAAFYAAQHGIPIYTIGLCVSENHPLRRFSVSYRAADNFDDLASGLQDTLAELPSFDLQTFSTGESTN